MLASLLLSLREGLEAALILGIVIGVLRRTQRPELIPTLWRGAASGLLGSLAAALLLNLAGAEFEGSTEIIFEGVTMLFAAGLLTWMMLWMQKQARGQASSIEAEVLDAARQGGKSALFWLAFFSILREGVELAVFLLAARLQSDALDTVMGTLLGISAAALLGWMAFNTTRRLSLGSVFRATNVLLALFAAGLVAHGVHEFIELGWIPPLIMPVWDLSAVLSEESAVGSFLKAVFGYSSSPALSEVLAYLAYFGLLIVWIRYWGRPAPAQARQDA
jgi:high-affinity iron transporter